MKIGEIRLRHFKNHSSADYEFGEDVVCITGPNASGKTNILDAIHYLCMTASYFHHRDSYAVELGEDFFRIEGDLWTVDGKTHRCVIKNPKRKSKEVIIDGVKLEKKVSHVGKWPVVFISPNDQRVLLYEGSKERQRFMDRCLSQMDKSYLKALQVHKKLLEKRNAALKGFKDREKPNTLLIHALDEQMLAPSLLIHEKRSEFAKKISPVFSRMYNHLSKGRGTERMALRYRSHLTGGAGETCTAEELKEIWRSALEKDGLLGYSTRGVHRDDLLITMNGDSLRNFASQGQVKSMVIALKLSQVEYMEEQREEEPLLLLDDIFEKLDSDRLDNLMKLLPEIAAGQVFLTDTDSRRIAELLKKNNLLYSDIRLKKKEDEEE